MDRQFHATFSFYCPEEGVFYDLNLKVNASDRFEAREKAWQEFEKNYGDYLCEQSARNVKLCGVNWEGNKLDMQDYFDAHAEACKTEINRLRNVDLVNHRREKTQNDERIAQDQQAISSEFGQLHLVDCIAKDLYNQHGIVPPSISTELQYAQKIADDMHYSGEHDLANHLEQHIWDAGKWESNSIFTIQQLFRDLSLFYNGLHVMLDKHFARDGCYPCSTEQTFESVIQQDESQGMGGIS